MNGQDSQDQQDQAYCWLVLGFRCNPVNPVNPVYFEFGFDGFSGARVIESHAALPSTVSPEIGLAAPGSAPEPAWAICALSASPNCPISCAATLWIIPAPRPYCAIEPASFTSECMSTRLPAPAG